MYGLPAIFVLVVVVFIHELGHFLVARWCGVHVSAFSIGFGREIVGFTDKLGTRWKLGWLPLGGYVKFMDDENGASVPSRDKLEAMTPEQRAGAFQLKPLWQRAAVVVAGPMANFISAVVMFAAVAYFAGSTIVPAQIRVLPLNPAVAAGLKTGDVVSKIDGVPITGQKQLRDAFENAAGRELTLDVERNGRADIVKLTPTPIDFPGENGVPKQVGYVDVKQVDSAQGLCGPVRVVVAPNHVAVLAGLRSGDLVKRVNGEDIADFFQLRQMIAKSAGIPLAFEVIRDGAPVTISVTPPGNERTPDGFGGFETRAIVGIAPFGDRSKLTTKYPSPLSALGDGVMQTWSVVTTTLGYLKDVVGGHASADKIGGLPTIIDVSNQMAQLGTAPIIQFIALISVSIGLLNLFPIPLLDGGHLMFYGIEAARGRPLSDNTQELCFKVGLSVVLTLMMFALWNDRFRMLGWVTSALHWSGYAPPTC